MTTHLNTHGAGVKSPANDEAPAVAAARGFRDQEQNLNLDSRTDGAAQQAVLTIAGGLGAPANPDRLCDGTAQRNDSNGQCASVLPTLAAPEVCRVGGNHG